MSRIQAEENVVESNNHQLRVAEQLPADLMLLKMENESIMSVARAVPRDPMKIVGQLKQLIDAYPQAADEAIYSKPVGTVVELTCSDCGIKYEVSTISNDNECPSCESKKTGNPRKIKKYAEGLSIRAAESIRSIYGYTRLSVTSQPLPDGTMKLTGVLVDYAAGNMTSDERIVTPWYKSKGGTMVKTPEDRFLNIVVKAEKSKLRRDIILDNTPGIVKALFRDACEVKLLDLVSPEVIEQKIIPAFLEHGITREHLDKMIGRPYKMGWREEDRLLLRKILSALKNGETTVKELLEDLQDRKPESKTSTNGSSQATSSDLTQPTASTEKETRPAKAQSTEKSVPTQVTGPADTQGAFAKYREQLEACETDQQCRHRYDGWFGPDSTVEFTPDQDKQASAMRDAMIEHIRQTTPQMPERMRLLKEKIGSYKQPARLSGLATEVAADNSFSAEEKQMAQGWISQRVQALQGNLALGG